MPVVWEGRKLEGIVRAAAMRGLIQGALRVKADAIRRIQEPPKSGRTYTRRGITHQASAPGEAPATDTGKLAGSIDIFPNFAALHVTVNAAATYAAALEYGTRHIQPRPYMRVSLTENLKFIERDVARAIGAAL